MCVISPFSLRKTKATKKANKTITTTREIIAMRVKIKKMCCTYTHMYIYTYNANVYMSICLDTYKYGIYIWKKATGVTPQSIINI